MSLSETYLLRLGKLVGSRNHVTTLEVDLPLVKDQNLCLYSFNLMGKGRLNNLLARALKSKLAPLENQFDIIVAVEAKSLALAQELSLLLGHDQYVVLRKSKKLYMGENALWVDSNSITTIGNQRLWLDEHDLSLLRGKRVLFLDDVISTGKTKKAAEQLLNLADAEITVVACVATEGKTVEDNPHDWIRLGHIPLYDAAENSI